jgi:hypothetical protein
MDDMGATSISLGPEGAGGGLHQAMMNLARGAASRGKDPAEAMHGALNGVNPLGKPTMPHPLLGGTQFNQPGPYGMHTSPPATAFEPPDTGGPTEPTTTTHPLVKARQRHQRISELSNLAKGNPSTYTHAAPAGPDPALEELRAKVAHLEGRVHP